MYSRLISQQTRLFRALALVSLLLLAAGQLLEAGHSHAAQDSAEHCLLCKSSTDGAAIVSHQAEVLPGFHAAPALEYPQPALHSFNSPHPARGPPLYT